jgi:hypothetical protein
MSSGLVLPLSHAAAAGPPPTDLVVASGSEVYRVPADGRPIVRIGDSVSGRSVTAIAAAYDGTVFVGNDDGYIYEFPAGGGPPVQRVGRTGGGFVTGIAVNHAGDVFWTCGACSGVAVLRSGSTTVESVRSPECEAFFAPLHCFLRSPTSMVIDGYDNVFVASADDGRVVEIPSDGGPQRDVVTGLTFPTGVAVDPSGNVYALDDGRILRVPPSGGPADVVDQGLGLRVSIATDVRGNLYISERSRAVVRVIAPDGVERLLDGSVRATLMAAVPAAPTVVVQDIGATRPVGALVLTQMCGANGALPMVPTLGFPGGLPAVPARNSSTVGDPTLPDDDPSLSPPTVVAGGTGADADPRTPAYPYPTDAEGRPNPTPSTHCGVDFGRARLVTRGEGAGQFFAAAGVLNQITAVDTRDLDVGWTITGQASDFTANGGTDRFGGSQLGWVPIVTEDTSGFVDSSGLSYDQLVLGGLVAEPNSQTRFSLGTGSVLAWAPEQAGLGVAIVDARLSLLIPVTADAGLYGSTLTITMI